VRVRLKPLRVVLCLAASFLGSAFAPAETYTADFGLGVVRAEVTTVDVQGVPHVPLGALLRQWGGTAAVESVAVRLQAGGGVVTGGINDNQLATTDARFGIHYPLLRRDDEVYIAAVDLPKLVNNGFGGSLPGASAAAPPIPPAQPLPEDSALPAALPEDAEDLLAPMTTPPTPAAPPVPEAGMLPEDPAALIAPLPDAAPPPGAGIRVVILDAGHGGTDAGTMSPEGLTEKDVTLRVAKKLEALLANKGGLTVYQTRAEDQALGARERAGLASSKEGQLLVSIHTGASYTPQATGCDVFHAPPPPPEVTMGRRSNRASAPKRDVSRESRYFAEAIAGSLQAAIGAPARPAREVPLRLLTEASMPAVLVEIGYLTNPSEATLLGQDAHLDQVAEGIAAGLQQALANAPGTTP
jgi:N-acetylmuramoyl-L-alanine amidase